MGHLFQRSIRNIFGIAVLMCISSLSSRTLAAEPKDVETTTQGDDYGYKFKDESLLGSTLAVGGDIFKGRRGFQRVLLIRPRTELISQLFKSVENL